MCREVPAAAESYGRLSRSNTLEFFKESARDAATPEFLRDAKLNNPEATLTRRIEQVPAEPLTFILGTQDASLVKVVYERLSGQKAESSAVTFHQVIDGT